jgi:ubiquinone/menaquinone biosynthesis C-methylase UbiE
MKDKDIVSNRKRIALSTKARLGWIVLKENGLVWTACLGMYYVCSSLAESIYRRMSALREAHGLRGINSTTLNYEIWRNWDWSSGGEEWTLSPEWKALVIKNVLRKNIPTGGTILEIGPGAGRWTEVLVEMADHLVAVDISDRCIELCKQKFHDCANAEFHVNDGCQLSFIAPSSIDSIWSFDVFVHINPEDVAHYIKEFARILKRGGRGSVHHAADGGKHGGWRSNLTAAFFREKLEENGLRVLEQGNSWEDGQQSFKLDLYNDVVTVFEKPA